MRRPSAPPDVHDEERLAALDDLPGEPGPEGFAAAVDEIMAAHAELLARLAQ
ncbi:hypothetical protein D3C83_315420 [compost metagenome]